MARVNLGKRNHIDKKYTENKKIQITHDTVDLVFVWVQFGFLVVGAILVWLLWF